jgi:threonine dehydrogenase-like Zn-dependent dehydrogenase
MDKAAVIPQSLSYEQAVFAALGAVSLYGIRRAELVPGECVVVLGLGIVGQLAVQLARLSGAYPVLGIEPIPYRRALAEQLGADETIDPAVGSWPDHVQNKWGGANVVLETAGTAALLEQCVLAAKLRGRIVILSSIYEPVQLHLFPGLDEKDVSLIGCHQPNNPLLPNVSYPWCQRRERELILNYIASGRLQIAPLISHRFKVKQAQQAYRLLLDPNADKMGILLQW